MLPENKSTSFLPDILFLLAFTLIGSFSTCNYAVANTDPVVYSKLWGKDGNLWDQSENGRLRDFTTVGYKNGNVLIPDWEPSVNVTEFGAIPDDGIDDSQAFIDAIAACKDGTAVFVPKGRYTILNRIQPDRNHFVLKGENMYETVLFFPRYLNEAELQEKGYDSSQSWKNQKWTGVPSGFIRMQGGTERSIENLTLEFREQMKGDHHDFLGGDAIAYGGNVTHSWVKNVVIRNADVGIMMSGAQNISVINMIFDNYIGRPSILGTSGTIGFDGHIGINLGGAKECLFHNIEFKGQYYHSFDMINVPSYNVISNITGSRVNLHHHGQGANHNLYTNVYVGSMLAGINALKDSQRQKFETHWGIYGDSDFDTSAVLDSTNSNHVFVGYGADIDETITETLWYEAIDPARLHPKNIYLAQLEFKKMPIPNYELPAPPTARVGNVIRVRPADVNDVDPGEPNTPQIYLAPKTKSLVRENFYKFDLNKADLTGGEISSIDRVRLRLTTRNFQRTPVTLGLWAVENDMWAQETITYANRPDKGTQLHKVSITEDSYAEVFDFDVTSYVKAEFLSDKIVSFATDKISGDGFGSYFRTTGSGYTPHLIIELVDSPVPGASTPPSGFRTETKVGNILIDWDDNPEADVVTYNVYRSGSSSEIGLYQEPVATGLVTSDFRDISSQESWAPGMMEHKKIYYYRVTAVDSHGYESESSVEFVGTPLGKNDTNKSPVFKNSLFTLDSVEPLEAVSGSLADQVVDPEGDVLHFFKIDGPDWLTLNYNGTFSGTPSEDDVGLNCFTLQVTAFGGTDEAVVEIQVGSSGNPDADNDGMNDFQEKALFGTLDGDGRGDIDGNGIKDYFQYLYGELSETYPGFSFTLTIDPEGNPTISWVTQSDYQLGKEYSLQVSSDLSNWAPLAMGKEDQLTQTPVFIHNKTIYELQLRENRGPKVFVRLTKL